MRIPTFTRNEDPVVQRITGLLLSQGKTQKDLMNYIGVAKSAYGDWKTGKTKSYRQHIDKIARFLNVSPSYLLRGDNNDITEFEKEFLSTLRELTKEQQEKLLVFAQSMCGKLIK